METHWLSGAGSPGWKGVTYVDSAVGARDSLECQPAAVRRELWLVQAKLFVLRYDRGAARLQVEGNDASGHGNDVEDGATVGRPAQVIAAIAADFLGRPAFGRDYVIWHPRAVANSVNNPRSVGRDTHRELVGRAEGERDFRTAVQVLDTHFEITGPVRNKRQPFAIARDRWLSIGGAFPSQAERLAGAPSPVGVQLQAP